MTNWYDNIVTGIKNALDSVYVRKSNTSGLLKNDGSVDSTTKEVTSHKTSSWNNETNHTRYPTEKLVKDSLDTKINNNDIRLTDARTPKFNTINATADNFVDLNNEPYTIGGFYYQGNANNAQYISNCPFLGNKNTAFYLLVETWGSSSNYVKQTLTYYDDKGTYIRTKKSTLGWSEWVKVSTSSWLEATSSATKDLNDFTKSGFYYCKHNTSESAYVDNQPLTSNKKAFYLLVEDWGPNSVGVKQTLTYYATRDTYIRTKTDSSTWTDWVLLLNNENYSNYVSTKNHTHSKADITVTTIPENIDLNTYITNGYYYCTATNYTKITNGAPPQKGNYAFILVVDNYNTAISQVVKSITSSGTGARMFYRAKTSAGWGDWKTIAFTSDIENYASPIAHTHTNLANSEIPSGADIDSANYRIPGIYYCSKTNCGNLVWTTAKPFDDNYAFILQVVPYGSYDKNNVQQILTRVTTSQTNNDIYHRIYTGSAWRGWSRILDSSNYSNYANKTIVDTALNSSSTNPVQNKVINTALSGKAPFNHRAEYDGYGLGDETYYGHCKIKDNLTSTQGDEGEALSAYQGNVLKGYIDNNRQYYITVGNTSTSYYDDPLSIEIARNSSLYINVHDGYGNEATGAVYFEINGTLNKKKLSNGQATANISSTFTTGTYIAHVYYVDTSNGRFLASAGFKIVVS